MWYTEEMANVVIPENHMLVAIEHRHSASLRSAMVTFGVRDISSSQTPVVTLSNAYNAYAAAIRPTIDSNVTFTRGIGTIQLPGGEYASVEVSGTTAGTGSTDRLPPNCAVLLRKITDRPGRTGRGRMCLPWAVGEAEVGETGVLTGGAVTAIQALADDFEVELTAVDLEHVLLHTATAPGGTTPSAVTGLQVQNLIGTQRRRLRG